jgi:hypothetical protein
MTKPGKEANTDVGLSLIESLLFLILFGKG